MLLRHDRFGTVFPEVAVIITGNKRQNGQYAENCRNAIKVGDIAENGNTEAAEAVRKADGQSGSHSFIAWHHFLGQHQGGRK